MPPRSLVAGAPARVRRAPTDDEVDRLRRNADHDVALAARYRDPPG